MAWQINGKMCFFAVLLPLIFVCPLLSAVKIAKAAQYSVVKLKFQGPVQNPKDVPARDIDFWARFRHESGSPEYKVHGFWDGDGKGETTGGDVLRKPGPEWLLYRVYE